MQESKYNIWKIASSKNHNFSFRTYEFYLGSIDNLDFDHIDELIDISTDAIFLYGTYKTAGFLIQNGVTVYQYILSYEGDFSFGNGYGVNHGDDLLYLWNYANIPLTEQDIIVQNIMTTAWANFAIFGDPTPPGMSDFSWSPLQSVSDFQFWNISGPNPTMDHSVYLQNRMELWQQIIGWNKRFYWN